VPPELTVVIPAHNPDAGRLGRTLAGLRGQTLPQERWETILIDNASERFPAAEECLRAGPQNLRLVREPELGLTAARIRGFQEARAPSAVLVDDDNVLAPDYLEQALRLLAAHAGVGALGGRVHPEFETEPAPWQREFLALLALREPGERAVISRGLHPSGAAANEYPVDSAPVGAGMIVRRAAWEAWLRERAAQPDGISDRRGGALTSSGDNDIVLTIMRQGWEVGSFPELSLLHLIPAGRLEARYLARLNRGIQESWMRVLTKHGANPWPPISPAGAALRQCKAWFSYRAWSGPAARIRWHGASGHFAGRVRSRPRS
jgi:glycosyltransferase involved in cell wall biosynthesis